MSFTTAGADNLYTKTSHQINIYSFSTGKTIRFPAMLTDFSDSYKSDWTETAIFGRMDNIATFKSTTRRINISFDLPSDSEESAVKNMLSIDDLIQGLYPVYEAGKLGTRHLSGPPLFRLSFANLANRADKIISGADNGLLGYLGGFDFKPELDSGVFIINNKIYPKFIKVSLGFTVIHEHPLGTETLPNQSGLPQVKIASFPHSFNNTAVEKKKAPDTPTTTVTSDKTPATTGAAADNPELTPPPLVEAAEGQDLDFATDSTTAAEQAARAAEFDDIPIPSLSGEQQQALLDNPLNLNDTTNTGFALISKNARTDRVNAINQAEGETGEAGLIRGAESIYRAKTGKYSLLGDSTLKLDNNKKAPQSAKKAPQPAKKAPKPAKKAETPPAQNPAASSSSQNSSRPRSPNASYTPNSSR